MFTKIVRIFLGVLLVFSAINKFWKIIPNPAGDFIESFGQVDYVLPIVGVFELAIGAMLLLKKWVAFALVLLAPISLNILLFHFYLDLAGIAPALLITALNSILIYKHWKQYKPLFN